MQEDLLKNRKAEELESSAMRANREKQRKKEEYDIEQVLQKHNQEVAKINVLREDVSAERSERVVYSNLFKKLESEIKYYEEEFKETLLVSFRLQERRAELLEELYQRKKTSSNPVGVEKSVNSLSVFMRGSVRMMESQPPQSTVLEPTVEQFFLTRESSQSHVKAHRRKESSYYNKRARAQLDSDEVDQYRAFFGKLLKQTSFNDVEELLEQFNSYERENECLLEGISSLNDEIYQLEMDLKAGYHRLNTSTSRKGPQTVRPTYSSLEEEVADEQSELIEAQQKLLGLTALLGIPYRAGSTNNLEEIFHQLQNKLAQLSQLQETFPNQQKQPVGVQHDRRNEVSELHIESLLQKSEKYQESEKIFTQDTFRQEYSRELSRSRKQKGRR